MPLDGAHPAYPVEAGDGGIYSGLTVREEFAKAAFVGFLITERHNHQTAAKLAVAAANALIEELNK